MSFIRLGVCVLGVYAMFLIWAIAQERLSVPFQSIRGGTMDKFKSPVFLGTCQSAMSTVSAFAYLYLRRRPGQTLAQVLGLQLSTTSTSKHHPVGTNRNAAQTFPAKGNSPRALLLRYLQCSFFITLAAPFGFAALSHISYPAMVLGKSCKLVPVMLMNVLLYRRAFARHKYVVVALVTAGITMFMGFGGEGKRKRAARNSEHPNLRHSFIGVTYLVINLAMDGATNSTQDEIFARFGVSGQQMMFWINLFCTIVTTLLSSLSLPYIPVLHPSEGQQTEFQVALAFLRTHPSVVTPLVQFALTGALGQLFIFETLQHFGSLTLVTVTLTRKLFTMLLSVVVYNHKLTFGQWAGAGVVFAGISVEAWVKRREVHARRVLQEKERAQIKSL
ncbi:UAA transporter [Dentipellis sp. KUC8613]|nr:UAA transporter [Dentipellis sp. KUC8613]